MTFYFIDFLSLCSKKLRKFFHIQFFSNFLSMLSFQFLPYTLFRSLYLDGYIEPAGKKKYGAAILHIEGQRKIKGKSFYFVKISKSSKTDKSRL